MTKQIIKSFIRDVTRVLPMPKSEVKRRLGEITTKEAELWYNAGREDGFREAAKLLKDLIKK